MLLASLGRRKLALLALLAAAVLVYATVRGATWTNDFKNPYRVARIFWQRLVLRLRQYSHSRHSGV